MDKQVQVRVRSVAPQSEPGQKFVGQVQDTNALLQFTASKFDTTIKEGACITVQVIRPVKDGLLEVVVCGEPSVVRNQQSKKRSFMPSM